MVVVFGGGKFGLKRMCWKGCSSYVLYEIWSLEGSCGGDVIAMLCMWEAKCKKGCHELVKRM